METGPQRPGVALPIPRRSSRIAGITVVRQGITVAKMFLEATYHMGLGHPLDEKIYEEV